MQLLVHAFYRRGGTIHIQHHGLGHAVKCQIAGNFQVAAVTGDAGADESCAGEFFHVKKVGGLKVRIALALPAVSL